LLRLIELESTGGFPIRVDKMKQLASLRRASGRIEASPSSEDQGTSLITGVSPNRQMPLLFYEANGQLCQRWADNVRIVYQNHPDLPWGEQLCTFWGIPPLTSDVKVLVSSNLLTRLGFDPEEFQQRLARKDRTACLYVDERGWKVRMDVERIEDFPDQSVELLIPALLARMIEKLDPRIVLEQYSAAGFGPYASAEEARQQIPSIEKVIALFKSRNPGKGTFQCTAQLSTGTGTGSGILWVRGDAPKGLAKDEWSTLGSEIDRATGRRHRVEFEGRMIGDGEFVESAPSAEAHMVTMFATHYEDIPDLLEYLTENRATLKVRVLNATNLEFVRTVQRTASLGTKGVLVVLGMFVVTCLVAISYSFLAMLQRKLGEIGILRAYGASRGFVFSRFALEIVGVCVFGAVGASLFFYELVLPWLNKQAAQMFPAIFGGDERVLTYSHLYVGLSVVIVVAAVFWVGLMVWLYIRHTPAQLLSMKE